MMWVAVTLSLLCFLIEDSSCQIGDTLNVHLKFDLGKGQSKRDTVSAISSSRDIVREELEESGKSNENIASSTKDNREMPSDCKCGVPGESTNRIIGGAEVNPHQYPWLVRLQGSHGSCTGSLISDRHILTAFHCVSENDESKPFDHEKEKDSKAYIGAHLVSVSKDDTDAEVTQVLTTPTDGFPPFPKFDPKNPESHDIVLYTLTEPVKFSSKVMPVCLPKAGHGSYEGSKAMAAGWGDFRKGPHLNSNVLRHAELTVSGNNKVLSKAFGTLVEKNSEGLYKDPCAGDSGGPLMWKNPDGQMEIIGVVHGGGYNCDAAEISKGFGTKDQIWNNVTSHLDWLEKKLSEDPETRTRRCV